MIHELTVNLTMSEIAAISQRSLAEQITGQVGGVFQGLWWKVQKEIEAANRDERKPEKERKP